MGRNDGITVHRTYTVNCPKCHRFIGREVTYGLARRLLSKHKKVCKKEAEQFKKDAEAGLHALFGED